MVRCEKLGGGHTLSATGFDGVGFGFLFFGLGFQLGCVGLCLCLVGGCAVWLWLA